MTLERWIRLIAGTCVLLSLALSQVDSVYWLWFTAFVGANLFQSALTRRCLMEDGLRTLGVRQGHAGRREDSGCPARTTRRCQCAIHPA